MSSIPKDIGPILGLSGLSPKARDLAGSQVEAAAVLFRGTALEVKAKAAELQVDRDLSGQGRSRALVALTERSRADIRSAHANAKGYLERESARATAALPATLSHLAGPDGQERDPRRVFVEHQRFMAIADALLALDITERTLALHAAAAEGDSETVRAADSLPLLYRRRRLGISDEELAKAREAVLAREYDEQWSAHVAFREALKALDSDANAALSLVASATGSHHVPLQDLERLTMDTSRGG